MSVYGDVFGEAYGEVFDAADLGDVPGDMLCVRSLRVYPTLTGALSVEPALDAGGGPSVTPALTGALALGCECEVCL